MHRDAAGELSGTAVQRRSRALWQAGRDVSTPAIMRYPARLVSTYERAPVRDIVTLGVFAMVEGAATGIMVRAALRITGASIPHGEGEMPPGSGRHGTLLALAIWLLPFAAVAIFSYR